MKILILNQDWFAEDFRSAGHEVVTCGLGEHLDVTFQTPLVHLDTIILTHLGGSPPDRILILDNSAPLIVEGLAETDIPLLFYSVDVHHHAELHQALCHVVDYVYMAQLDYCGEVASKSPVPVEWLPLWASRYVDAQTEKKHGCVFVGTLDRELNPDRVDFFEELQKEVPMLCMTGKYWEIFPESLIVINQTVKGDLNFRVFEAMMCGAMLLTEMSQNGLTSLFEPGQHLVTYEKGNVKDAAEKIRHYLSHPEEARRIAQAGRDEILARHTPGSRASRILQTLIELKRTQSNQRFYSWMKNFTALSNRLRKLDTALSKRALLSAVRAAETGIQGNEVLEESSVFALVYACCRYDLLFQSQAGHDLLRKASEQYPQLNIFTLALIRNHLNRGEIGEARGLVSRLGVNDEQLAFSGAEQVITELLNEGSEIVPLHPDSGSSETPSP